MYRVNECDGLWSRYFMLFRVEIGNCCNDVGRPPLRGMIVESIDSNGSITPMQRSRIFNIVIGRRI